MICSCVSWTNFCFRVVLGCCGTNLKVPKSWWPCLFIHLPLSPGSKYLRFQEIKKSANTQRTFLYRPSARRGMASVILPPIIPSHAKRGSIAQRQRLAGPVTMSSWSRSLANDRYFKKHRYICYHTDLHPRIIYIQVKSSCWLQILSFWFASNFLKPLVLFARMALVWHSETCNLTWYSFVNFVYFATRLVSLSFKSYFQDHNTRLECQISGIHAKRAKQAIKKESAPRLACAFLNYVAFLRPAADRAVSILPWVVSRGRSYGFLWTVRLFKMMWGRTFELRLIRQ
jgi:hypothetical protein